MYEGEVARWRALMIDAVRPVASLPLLLSGGIDSGTLLAAALACGARPACYVFQLGGVESEDARAARSMALTLGCSLSTVESPRTLDRLVADVQVVTKFIGHGQKTHVQCCHPVLHLVRRLREDGHECAVIGTGGVVEDARACAVILGRDGEAAARAHRRERLLGTGPSATNSMIALARSLGVEMVQPYAE